MSGEFDSTSYALIINGNNLDTSDRTNSRYVFQFSGTKKIENTKVCISNCSVFYNWYNISASFSNNTFSFIFPNGAGFTTYNVTIPDGYYSIPDLNSYLQQFMINNNLYLVNPAGQFVYYLEIIENPSAYKIQLNCYPVPTALPGSWTNPGIVFPPVLTTPQFVIPATNFRNLIGFNAQTFPVTPQTTTQSKLSDFTPRVNTIENVIIRSNLVSNSIANPSDTLYSFNASGTTFGGLVNSQPNFPLYLDVQDGYYSSIDIQFCDQNFNPIQFNDPNIIVQLAFKTKIESSF
jgi:hypothetical protein